MRTPPPCKLNGKDCEHRNAEPNCHTFCPDWIEWVKVHDRETATERRNRDSEREIDSFLVKQGERTRSDNLRKQGEKRRKNK